MAHMICPASPALTACGLIMQHVQSVPCTQLAKPWPPLGKKVASSLEADVALSDPWKPFLVTSVSNLALNDDAHSDLALDGSVGPIKSLHFCTALSPTNSNART